jgi:ferredoxin
MERLDRFVFACSCEGTQPLDTGALARGCGGALETADQLCGRELDRLKAALASGRPVTVGCRFQAPLFTEVAQELGAADRLATTPLREAAGWSREAAAAGPKMAALLAAAAEAPPPVPLVSLESQGVALIYGRDEAALAAAERLEDALDITVLLSRPEDVAPPKSAAFPVLAGTITGAKGHLGAFELNVDGLAQAAPSSRTALVFGPTRDGAVSRCDLILDLTGGAPLFPAADLRPGYLRADPRDPAQVERAIAAAANLVGTFDKPRYIDFKPELCAHSRNRITGCTRCLELCPTGAIAPSGDHVAIDPAVCAGCGSCAAACPTGAAAYALPPVDHLLRTLRTLLRAYAQAGGERPLLLLHDAPHGAALIEALARFGEGLPAHVLPVAVNETTQVGPEALAAAFAYGAAGVRLLTRARPKHDASGLQRTIATANTVLEALGYGRALVGTIETDDPDALAAALARAPLGTVPAEPASFLHVGRKRGLLETALLELHRVAPTPVPVVPLAAGAPVGGLAIDVEGCTLCLSCAGACPTNALSDNPERPQLNFTESLCVQCGLCAATCPEKVITLQPQLDFAGWQAGRRVVKEEEPFHCVACAKPFGTRSAIERVTKTLADRHWMFSGSAGQSRLRLIQMCEDCRVEASVAESFDPHTPPRPVPRTAGDYGREGEGKISP